MDDTANDGDVPESYEFEMMGSGVGGKSTVRIRTAAMKNFEEFLLMKKLTCLDPV